MIIDVITRQPETEVIPIYLCPIMTTSHRTAASSGVTLGFLLKCTYLPISGLVQVIVMSELTGSG